MSEVKRGRKPNPNRKISCSVRIDSELIKHIDSITHLTRTQAIEYGLKLVLAYETKEFYKKALK